jgi:hypothetical protein
VALLVFAVAAIGVVFWSNTESLTIIEDAGPFEPGEALTIELSLDEGDCGPSFEHLYRRTLFGRWRLTHTSDDGRSWARHHRGLLSLGSWEDFSPLPCPLQGSDADLAPFTVPPDVTWSPAVACSHNDENCVVIDIDLASG